MTQITEIPINNCSESGVSFYKHWGKSYSGIRLYFKQNSENITLDSIFLVIKSHLWVRIPKHTFMGINQLHPCPIIPDNKRKKNLFAILQGISKQRPIKILHLPTRWDWYSKI
jgi:hypothetical protein